MSCLLALRRVFSPLRKGLWLAGLPLFLGIQAMGENARGSALCDGGKDFWLPESEGYFQLHAISPVPKPPVISRTAWGCPDGQESPNWPGRTYTTVTHLIVHHSATGNSSSDWAGVVRAIYADHSNPGRFGDMGYNYLIDPVGRIYEGRAGGDNVMGAHFSCFNTGTMGVCLLGNFETAQPGSAALESLKKLLAWKAAAAGIDPRSAEMHAASGLPLDTISGHRDGNPSHLGCPKGTVCPGANLFSKFDTIREGVAALMAGEDTTNPSISAFYPSASIINEGETVRLHFRVSDSGGTGLSKVQLYRNDFTPGENDPRSRMVAEKTLSGNGPVVDFYTDRPPTGQSWYGLTVWDGAMNRVTERTGGWGPDKVVVQAWPAPSIRLTRLGEDELRLEVSGAPGMSVAVESSADLRAWGNDGAGVLDGIGRWEKAILHGGVGAKFYRVRRIQP